MPVVVVTAASRRIPARIYYLTPECFVWDGQGM
jgi:hypothetical protein